MQEIKNRIQSIESTRQITRSMRLVSTSKVQRVRTRMAENRPFFREAEALIQAAGQLLAGENHPYFAKREGKKTAVVAICGDRGLCGGYNVNVIKELGGLVRTLDKNETKIITIGQKARDYGRRRFSSMLAQSFVNISENPFFQDAQDIAALLLDWYNTGVIDRVYVVYTRFETMLSHIPTTRQILPLAWAAPEGEEPARMEPHIHVDPHVHVVRSEPEGPELLDHAVPHYLSALLYNAILESATCEQSARISSMDAAARNADDMIDTLTLKYNQIRQDAITQELVEIVGGANAV